MKQPFRSFAFQGLLLLFGCLSMPAGHSQQLPSNLLELPPAPRLAGIQPRLRPVIFQSSDSAAASQSPAPGSSELTLPGKPTRVPAASPDPPELEDAPAAPPPAPALEPAPDPGPITPDPLPGEPVEEPGHPFLSPSPLLPVPPGGLPEGELPQPEGITPMPEAGNPNPDLPETTVPPEDLAPSPQKDGDASSPSARGPLFRIRGTDAWALARQRGFRFSPAQGLGRRDGNHTVASQVPNVLTSEVHGVRMTQMRPAPLWSTPWIENTFYMFCDHRYNAVRLSPGWKIRGIQLQGPDWQWVACPRSGANTASFSIRIRSWKVPSAPPQGSVVILQGLTLEGPPGATNWKEAFPDLTRRPLQLRAR